MSKSPCHINRFNLIMSTSNPLIRCPILVYGISINCFVFDIQIYCQTIFVIVKLVTSHSLIPLVMPFLFKFCLLSLSDFLAASVDRLDFLLSDLYRNECIFSPSSSALLLSFDKSTALQALNPYINQITLWSKNYFLPQ